mgnify:FL=1
MAVLGVVGLGGLAVGTAVAVYVWRSMRGGGGTYDEHLEMLPTRGAPDDPAEEGLWGASPRPSDPGARVARSDDPNHWWAEDTTVVLD